MALATEDILAIQKLIADYNHFVDAGDGEEFAALFTDDGSLDTGFNVVKGSNELRDFAALVPSMAPGARHLVSNVSIDGSGSDATARLYLQMWSTAGGAAESKLVISGRYDDTLRRLLDAAAADGVVGRPETSSYTAPLPGPPRIESCYRSFEMQQWWRDFYCFFGNCSLAAVPGTSVHGWGRAVDFEDAGGELTFDSAGYHWLKANAGRFGFVHPAWAEPGQSSSEPWHWELP